MLTLTENATAIVKELTTAPDAPETAGLRISSAPETGFAVAATPQPEPGDLVVEQDGATVYLDQPAAEQLDAMVLDAGVDETGSLQFGLMAQG
ncbi:MULTISPECIES: Fe-S cluster assembly protein HesB [Nocardioides]|uniref:Fe-S cluster assembly protein HesB n=1 Tax=Nocardioides vastitatis TaxID=2568655 RepID=A0ABW0ZIL5_9ACTN|nr:Fe-S cluster assembly protein HesB [Nocardioides sp.]THJ14776.1 Fe-S cluster assembly protein HesB [Nocardioides sp.]